MVLSGIVAESECPFSALSSFSRLPLGLPVPRCIWLDLFSVLHIADYKVGFPASSVGKESACNAGAPSSIPGSGRSAGEGRGYPLQYSWTSLAAQMVKNLPAMQTPEFDP